MGCPVFGSHTVPHGALLQGRGEAVATPKFIAFIKNQFELHALLLSQGKADIYTHTIISLFHFDSKIWFTMKLSFWP